jgi:hypothetical protein
MGRWTHLKGKLPELIAEGTWYDRVRARQKQLQGLPIADLGEHLKKRRKEKDAITEQLSEINLEIEAAQNEILAEMDRLGVESLKLASGGSLFLRYEPYSKVTGMEELKTWMKKNKMTELLTVNWQTLNAVVKERFEEGQAAPSGVEVFLKTSLSLRGGKDRDDEDREA